MILLTLDPSSKRIGYAVSQGPAGVVTEAGLIKPAKASAPKWVRIQSMVADVRETIAECKPGRILIESPSGKVHRSKKASMGAGQSIYGAAFGVVWQVCIDAVGEESVEVVDANVWTRQAGKESRARVLMQRCPGVDLSSDKGLDMADAIELALWWWDRSATRTTETIIEEARAKSPRKKRA